MVELRANFNARILKLENQYDIRRELININADKRALDVLASNMDFLHVRLEQVDTREANRIKQEVIKLGGEAAISQEAYSYTVRTTSMLIAASRKNLEFLAKKLATPQFELEIIGKELERCLNEARGNFVIGNKIFDFNHTAYLSGIVRHRIGVTEKRILDKVERYCDAGADIIEVLAGYPGGILQPEAATSEECKEFAHLIYMIKKNFPHVVISTDMAKVGVAKAAFEAGAEMFCDVIPIRYNLEFIQFIAKHNLPMMLMYAPGINRMPQPLGVVSDILRDIQANTNFAVSNGIPKEKIIIDPSICFGRKDKDNFLMMRQLSNFRHLKMPISIMFSRKSFLNSSLVGSMRKQQINSVITNTLAVLNNCNIVRLESVEQISLLRNILNIIHPSVEA